jgi:hypothetical protein
MIWEYTWPAPRLIEPAVYCSEPNEGSEEPEPWDSDYGEVDAEYTILRPTCSVFRALKEDLIVRTLFEEPLEFCPNPVALQVCRESRKHTLTQYTLVSHAYTPAGSFYFSSYRDLLYLCFTYMEVRNYSEHLQENYGAQLSKFETVLVEDFIWEEATPTKYTTAFLTNFEGLRIIRILFTENDYFDTSDEGDSSHEAVLDDEDAPKAASRLRAEYAKECLDHPEWTAKKFELMDRSGKLY